MISLIQYEEFGKGMGLPSMRDSFQKEKYEGQNKIIEYLKNGKQTMVAVGKPIDFFTGEQLTTSKVFMNDGKFSWINTLAYYVEHYNLRLPQEFEDYVLKK